ncbi:MAG TPA: hypothetical protein VG712_05185 [Gemmatimonadales bacterium]|nr:hypothetical protein [Gemmatimonadales bacterium]
MRSGLPLLLASLSLSGSLALVSCGSTPTEPEPPPGAYRVLFVGNSLTYTNDLPAMVEAIALANGDTFYTKSLAFPDWGLQDHWEEGSAPDEITKEEWDVVVMQQGPSSLPESRVDLLLWAGKFGDLAAIHHTCTAMYEVWPAKNYLNTMPAVHDHYAEAADSIGGLFLPAGDAWINAWAKDADLALYGPDNFHPSPLGTYLAALAVYSGLTGRSPVGNTATVPGVSLDANTRKELQLAAWEAAYGLPRRCGE